MIQRKDGVFIFFDEKTFYAIQSGEIKIHIQTGIKKRELHQQNQLKSIKLKSVDRKPVKISKDKNRTLPNKKKHPDQSSEQGVEER